AFLKHVLIDVRHGARVRIEAGFAGKQFYKTGTVGTGQTHGDARLQDAVAIDHQSAFGIKDRPVQRVSHRAGELPRGVAGQFSVGVQGDDILDVRQQREVPHDV